MRRINSFSCNIDMQVGPPRCWGDKTNWYLMPVDGTIAKQEEIDVSALLKLTMCQMAMRKLYEIGNTRLHNIQSAAHATGVGNAYGNKGKSMTIKDDDPRMPPIRGHFNHLLVLGG